MSVLLKELVGSKAKIRFDEEFSIAYEYTILAVDEDWVKISRELANGELETKLVRVDNIVDLSI
ncbi:aspartyl-tRNA synthetase [Streptococcus suis]|nr:aspartyl-tRNA synthetase [Streptococcus suis]